ncbi:putative glycosyltransferase WbgO [Escherichia coli DEC2C]|nr:putative glycosyltransferase WbgO [Escherichia coli DEC2C]
MDVVGTNAIFIDDKGREINKTKLPEENLDIVKTYRINVALFIHL